MRLSRSQTGNSQGKTPFFPPGIAQHKNVKALSNINYPITVKQIKNKKRVELSANVSWKNDQKSSSTPNLNYLSKTLAAPKHICEAGSPDIFKPFKAAPLPRYYSPESLKRNQQIWQQSTNIKLQTQSLDRVNSKKYLSLSSNNIPNSFQPDKPFYPPSKYPNLKNDIHGNIARLVETRNLYKTPKSRKEIHRKSKRSQSLNKPSENLSGENLTVKRPKDLSYHRKSTKLDEHDHKKDQMTSSYFYPKPTLDSLFTDKSYGSIIEKPSAKKESASKEDIMLKSLLNESTLADKINSGTLERASRSNYVAKNESEFTEYDDSPRKYNSLSIDSLDGKAFKTNEPLLVKDIHLGDNDDNEDDATKYQNLKTNNNLMKDGDSLMDINDSCCLDDAATPVITNGGSTIIPPLGYGDQFNMDKFLESSHQHIGQIEMDEERFRGDIIKSFSSIHNDSYNNNNNNMGNGINMSEFSANYPNNNLSKNIPEIQLLPNTNSDDVTTDDKAYDNESDWSSDEISEVESNEDVRHLIQYNDGKAQTAYRNVGHNSNYNNRDTASEYHFRDGAWLSSPDVHTAFSDINGVNTWNIRQRLLQSENPLKPLCNYCFKPAYFNERISISNLIFHRSCFRCRRCNTHLSFKNCVLHRKKLYCEVHIRSKIWKSVRSG